MNIPMQLAIKVDVDTRIGMREGVPHLLDLFRRHSIGASFFVSFGPDHSGRALARLRQPGFLRKMWRTNPLRLYGLRTLLSGTLLPSLPVGEGFPAILKDIVASGHELGIHGYDHVLWQDHLEEMSEEAIEQELGKSRAAYKRVLGAYPTASAAPGWKCTPLSLAVQDRLEFLYASDLRGSSPFVPLHEGRKFKTLQIPTTLPTMDELLGREKNINACLLSCLGEGLNVHTVHAEVEGRPYLSLFEGFVEKVRSRKVEFVLLREVAESIMKRGLASVPLLPVGRNHLPGRSGWVACQGTI